MRNPTAGAAIRLLEGRRGPHECEPEDDDWTHDSRPVDRVYALLDPEACAIKIGFTTKDVEVRKREHERVRGRKLELLGTMAGGRTLERVMHRRFANYRCESREWFSSEIALELLPLLDAA